MTDTQAVDWYVADDEKGEIIVAIEAGQAITEFERNNPVAGSVFAVKASSAGLSTPEDGEISEYEEDILIARLQQMTRMAKGLGAALQLNERQLPDWNTMLRLVADLRQENQVLRAP